MFIVLGPPKKVKSLGDIYVLNCIKSVIKIPCGQGSRKLDPWGPVYSDKTYLVRQKENSTHGILNTTHRSSDKPKSDRKTVQQMRQTFLMIGQKKLNKQKLFFLCLK